MPTADRLYSPPVCLILSQIGTFCIETFVSLRLPTFPSELVPPFWKIEPGQRKLKARFSTIRVHQPESTFSSQSDGDDWDSAALYRKDTRAHPKGSGEI